VALGLQSRPPRRAGKIREHYTIWIETPLEAAEELDFDWPEFVPVERVIRGITEIALVTGVAVFWCFVWSDFLKR
jgi:hypothetical protein